MINMLYHLHVGTVNCLKLLLQYNTIHEFRTYNVIMTVWQESAWH